MKIRLSFTAWPFVSLLYDYTLVREIPLPMPPSLPPPPPGTGHINLSCIYWENDGHRFGYFGHCRSRCSVHHHKVVRAPMERRAGELTHAHVTFGSFDHRCSQFPNFPAFFFGPRFSFEHIFFFFCVGHFVCKSNLRWPKRPLTP